MSSYFAEASIPGKSPVLSTHPNPNVLERHRLTHPGRPRAQPQGFAHAKAS
ncbi:transcription factor 19 [Rattus norvegicus]|uniref:Transcription factor 19 n=1 Tax=Rattus norvegicus TaxID=10116 RepID=A6KTB6_RAT|nr:transcription factor 19 [Rattus norvegicus]